MSNRKQNRISDIIREIPVMYLMELKFSTLDKLEKKLKREVDYAALALKWIQGIKQVKKASKDGEQHGE